MISDFRYRKIIPYTRDEETIAGMKIISMDTDYLKRIIESKIKYKYLYVVFDKYHEVPLETIDWHEGMIKEAIGECKKEAKKFKKIRYSHIKLKTSDC